jgi:hypothetical protein
MPRPYTPRNASHLTPKTSPKPESSYPELRLLNLSVVPKSEVSTSMFVETWHVTSLRGFASRFGINSEYSD